MLIHFLVRDEPNIARFQSGVLTLAGKAKPAYGAYQLPFAQTARTGSRTALWGQLRAPGAGGSVRIERRSGGVWRTVATLSPGAGRFFRWTGRCRAARRCGCTPAASPGLRSRSSSAYASIVTCPGCDETRSSHRRIAG